MGIVNRAEAIDVTDWARTDPKGRLPQEYKDKGLTPNTIIINGYWFNGVSRDSSLGWEEFVWSEEPTRSNNFAFTNMDDLDVGLVAQCQVNFKYFNIEDFKRFREAIKQRYFRCTFFNVDTGEWEYNREMYCSKSERQKLYYFNPKLLGVLDFSVTLVATNRELTYPDITVTYDLNGQSGTLLPDTDEKKPNHNLSANKVTGLKWGEQYPTLSENCITGNISALIKFGGWNTKADGSGLTYMPTQSITLFKDTTLYAIWLPVENIKFETASWDKINEISQAGVGPIYFKVGDEKEIQLSTNEVITVIILDFNHDDLTSGGKAGITIGMKNLLTTPYAMNESNINSGGWNKCALRTQTMPIIFTELPSDLQGVIKAVNKVGHDGDGSSEKPTNTVTTSSDKLWIPALAEVYSKTAMENTNYSAVQPNLATFIKEGYQYEYYKKLISDTDLLKYTNKLIKRMSDGTGEAQDWWLRTPVIIRNYTWMFITNDGHAYGAKNAGSNAGVSFCFCI